jgi:hypothetical protein
MLATSVTAATRMLPVLSNTAVTGTNVSPLLSMFPQACKYKIRAAISSLTQFKKKSLLQSWQYCCPLL